MIRLKLKKEDYLLILSMVCIVVNFAMNVFCMKPLSFGLPFIVMDGGLLISWISFSISNVITETYGEKVSYKIIIISSIVSFILLCLGVIISYIPTSDTYLGQATHFYYVFNNGIRTYFASSLAFCFGNITDIYIVSMLKKKKNDGSFFIRTVISTFIGQAVDNFAFEIFAFFPIGISAFEMRIPDIFTASVLSTFIETIFAIIFLYPVTYRLIKKIRES